MLTNPFLPSPPAAAAWAEGFTKGFLAVASPQPGENVGADDIEAFNQGVEAGAQCAVSGFEPEERCLPAAEDKESPAEGALKVLHGAELAHSLWEWAHLGKAAQGVAGIVVLLLQLAISLPRRIEDPATVLAGVGQTVADTLASYGLDSMALYCGAGVDPGEDGCEVLLAPLFAQLDSAREAAIATGRPQWIVVSWRTDQSNSFRIVDAG